MFEFRQFFPEQALPCEHDCRGQFTDCLFHIQSIPAKRAAFVTLLVREFIVGSTEVAQLFHSPLRHPRD
ncbi:hypothetical protein BOC58_32060 [Burkholderia pseudomallei]|nr:hypothetical protein BOC58_32060 [Burkholderia pseudomallei]